MTAQGYPKNLNGLCIGVLSGDRVIFQGPISKQTNLPLQKILHLIGLQTPKVDLINGEDQPFGYASRQYLRSRLVGKTVPFTVQTKVNEIELGYVTYQNSDISISLLRQGLAKIRNDKVKCKNIESYKDAEQIAKNQKKNLWSDKPEKQNHYQRKIVNKTLKQIYQLLSKNKTTGVVQEIHPSKATLYIPTIGTIVPITSPELQVVVLSEKKQNGQSKNNARQIRTVLEGKVLNKQVQLHIRGFNNQSLTGHIYTENFDIRKTMLTFGYAKLSKQALNILDLNQFKDLKLIAQQAASKGRGLWKDQKQSTSKTKSLNEQIFIGKVAQVFSGDSLRVVNLETNQSTRIYLANVKAPQQGKPFAFEAREALRKRAIGKKVKVDIEFSKNILVKKNQTDKGQDKNFIFATVFQNNKNLGAYLLQEGLVTVSIPRVEEQFTKYIEDLKAAEQEGKKKKKGLNGQVVRIPNFNDVTSGKDSKNKIDLQKAKTIYNFLKDQKKLTGVVDFILNGSRIKVRINQQSCYIILVIQGIRCLPNEQQYKKYSQLALQYSKQNLSQRDVDIELSKIDKKGVFHGTIFVDKQNYALELLRAGLAIQFGRSPYQAKYQQYQNIAKKNKFGLWSTPLNLAAIRGEDDRQFKPVNITKNLKLIEVVSAEQFYLDVANIKKPQIPQKVQPVKQPKQGQIYAVKFSVDNIYYRGKVKRILKNNKYLVHYIDFGNYETVSLNQIGYLDKALKQIKSSLFKCGLYGIEHSTIQAANLLKDFIEEELKVQFKQQCNGQYNVILSQKDFVLNQQILAEGYGQLSIQDAKWQLLEKQAQAARRGKWKQENDD